MAAQDLRELVPRVRRALIGPGVTEAPPPLDDDDVILAITADAVADIILFTGGAWDHTLEATERDNDTNVPTEWSIHPALSFGEESLVAAQAALTYFFHSILDVKVSERIKNEGQEWEWSKSSSVLRDQIKLLQDQRDRALEGLVETSPALARYASILEVRDRAGAALLEQWRGGGLGGQEFVQLWP